MTGVWLRVRSELRTRLGATLVLSLLIGVVAGVVLGAAIGARRTATAPDRLTASLDGRIDVQILDLGEVELRSIEELPMVERASVSRFLVSDIEFDLTTSTDQTFATQLVEGAVEPEDPLTALVDSSTAEGLDVDVGDQLDLALYSVAQFEAQDPTGGPQGPHVSVRIVGLVQDPGALDAADPRSVAALGSDGILVLPASFLERYDDAGLFINVFTSVQLRNGGADVPAFKAAVRDLPGGVDLDFLDAEETQGQAAARRAVRGQALALAGLAVALMLAAGVTVGQVLLRHLRAGATDDPTLQALGMTSGERARVGVIRGLVIGGLSAPLAIATAIASSWLTPIGVARQGEPNPGVEVNIAWLAVGYVAIVLLVTAVAGLGAGRAVQRATGDRAPGGARPGGSIVGAARRRAGAVLGTALALSFGTRAARLATRTATIAITIAIITVAGGAVLVASLARVTDDPARYGWTFDAVAGSPFEEDPGDLFDLVEQTPGIASVAGAANVTLELDGRSLSVLAVESNPDIRLRATEGRMPTEAGEIALGRRTLEDLGLSIGSPVSVDAEAGPVDLVVTGTVVVPELTGLGAGVGEGGVLTLDALERVAPDALPNLALLRFEPGQRDRAFDSFAALSQDVHPLVDPYLPSTLYQLIRIRNLFALLSTLVVVLAVATLVHSIVGVGQHRRRELAVLRALGFTRRQITSSALAHAATCTAAGLVVGLPLGLAAGRLAWTALGRELGVPDSPVAPLVFLLAMAPLAFLVAIASSAGPGWWAARTAPTRPSRTE